MVRSRLQVTDVMHGGNEMAKDKREEQARTTMEVFVGLANMLRTIASHRDITIPEAFDRVCQSAILREYRKCVAEVEEAVLGGES